MLPGVSLFLDIDDLDQAGGLRALEDVIGQSHALLIMLTDGYFSSKNCRREVRAALRRGLPLILVHDTDPSHGGLPLEALRMQCPQSKRDEIFSSPIIEWHRMKEFQLVSLRLIGEHLIRPLLPLSSRLRGTYGDALDTEPGVLYVSGELSLQRLLVPAVISFSRHNLGVEELISELHAAGEQAASAADSEECFLLLLDGRTQLTAGSAVEADVLAALDSSQKVVVAYDPSVPFRDCIALTSDDLLGRGIFDELAVPLHQSEHREVSLRLIALKLQPPQTSKLSSCVAACRKAIGLRAVPTVP